MKDLETRVYKHLKDRNWHNLRPVDIAKSIMIEGAELLELFQWENLSLSEVKNNKQKIKDIKSELADVIIYVIELSVLLGLDTEKIIKQKLVQVAKKYPAKLMRQIGRSREPGTETAYWRIKKSHRHKKLKKN
ncbi:MAG: MazG-like family protein [Patescibacteria group bacterium]